MFVDRGRRGALAKTLVGLLDELLLPQTQAKIKNGSSVILMGKQDLSVSLLQLVNIEAFKICSFNYILIHLS